MLGDPPIYYEVSTTTVFSGPVTICIDYSGVTFQNPSLLHLFHYEDTNSDGTPDTWVDRTTSVDTVNHIICATVDSFSLFAVLEKFDLPATLDGRMFGVGHIDQHQQQHHFVFRVAQIDSHDRGRFEYWVNATRACDPSHVVGDRQDDDDHDRDHDRDHCSAPNRFEATSITSVVFADDPAFRPDRGVRPVVDTVRFSGSGRWNGRPGYSFEVVATDHGEPGRGRDTLALIVKDSSDNVVATISGSLDGGNIQSTRLRP
jgi:hypothetical protein